MNYAAILAKRLTDNGVYLKPKHNSLFTAMLEYGAESELVNKAVTGLVNVVKSDVDKYRNVILPLSRRLEDKVKSKASVSQTSVADRVKLSIIRRNGAIDAINTTDTIDSHAVNVYTNLPASPVVIEYDEDLVKNNIRGLPESVRAHMEYILAERPNEFLKSVHEQYFSNISSEAPAWRNAAISAGSDIDKAYTVLALVLSYRLGTLGPSNKAPDTVKQAYLSIATGVFVNAIRVATDTYDLYTKQDILISAIRSSDSKVFTVVLNGDVYDKFIADNTIDVLLGYVLRLTSGGVPDYVRTTLQQVLDDKDLAVKHLEEANRVQSAKNAADHIGVLRTVYKVVVAEYLNSLDDNELSAIGLSRNTISAINADVEVFVNKLTPTELLETTEVTRMLAGAAIFDDSGFKDFTDSMKRYAKLFPKLNVDEIATCATVELITTYLEHQYVVERD